MIIALDATPLTVPTGGTGRYTSELALALAAHYPEDQFWLLSDQPFTMPAGAPENLKPGAAPRTALARKWWLWGLQQEMTRRRADVFHGTDFSVPYLPLRAGVMTILDLSPWLFPEWQPGAARVRRRTPLLLRAGLAAMVITLTEAVRREVMERFGLRGGRVVAIPLAASGRFRPVEGGGAGRYFLFVGTLEPRKNIAMLIEAWRELRKTHPDVDLVVAGRTRSDFQAPAPEPGLRLLGAVDDEELPALYSGALALVYPSFYEGFGLPVLEAMQCGAAVVASCDASLMEVSGGAAMHAGAKDTRAWVEALRTVCESPDRVAQMRERSLKRSREFSWRRTAEATREVYNAARLMFGKR